MLMQFLRRGSLLAVAASLLGIGAQSISAQEQFVQPGAVAPQRELNWAEKMFDRLKIDFGVVARGADTRFRVIITNKYKETVHIASVTTTCGCAAAKPAKETLASLESTYIEVTMDTRKFTNRKDSNVIVKFDQPFYEEVRVPVTAYIRTDVVIQPGGVDFGSIGKGLGAERRVNVAYAGRDTWAIRDIVSKNPNVSVKAQETARGGGRVSYDLIVAVKPEAPLGDLREQLILMTDDAGNPQIPLLVEGRVESEFSVNQDVVSFGLVKPGERKTVNVVIRGRRPFAIKNIESERTSGTFEVRLPQEAKTIHVLPLTLVAPTTGGSIDEMFTVTIDGSNDTVIFKALAKVDAPAAAPATAAPASVSN